MWTRENEWINQKSVAPEKTNGLFRYQKELIHEVCETIGIVKNQWHRNG